MSRPQRRPNKAITQVQQQTAVFVLLAQRPDLPDAAMTESIARSYGLHVDLVRAMVEGERIKRRMRA